MKRRRVWLWLLAPLGVLAAVAALIVWDAHRRADAVLGRERKDLERRIEAFRARDFRRPPAAGEGVDGNAWDLYELHLPALKGLSADEQAEIPEIEETWDPGRLPDDEVLDVLYLKYAPQIQGLRDAQQCRVVDARMQYERGSAVELPLVNASILTARFLAGGMAHRHRMGRGSESLELAALGLGLAHDQRPAIVGFLVQLVTESIIAENVLSALADHGFPAAALERFAGELDRLDAARPTPKAAWDEEEVFVYCNLVAAVWEAETSGGVKLLPPLGWKQLWSWKLARAQALSRFPKYFDEGRHLLALPTPVRVREVKRLLEEAEKEELQIPRFLLPALIKTLAQDVEGLALRALLRVAVALAWHEAEKGAFPVTLEALVPRYLARVPTCPYSGKPLGYKDGKVWSTGKDGVDNGGACDPLDPRQFEKAGTDNVCPVKRRKP